MESISRASVSPALALAVFLESVLAASLSAATLLPPRSDLTATKAGNDLILSFPTASPEFYTVQTCPDLQARWINVQPGVPGDGTVRLATITNGISSEKGFYRVLIQTPVKLLVPESLAFGILGHSCGGIQEKAYVTDFDPSTGNPAGYVYLSTTCSTGGRGSRPATFSAWAAVAWDFAGNAMSATTLSNSPTVNAALTATDLLGDTIYNAGAAAYLAVPIPAAPVGVSAVQTGDEFQVSWTPNGVNPAAVTSSTLLATPIHSTASTLTTTVAGPATTGIVFTLQPQTTYQITVVSTTVSGSSPSSAPVLVTTVPASVPASAPTGVTARWTNLDPTGTADTLVASWQAAVPGDSPIDQYQVTIVGSDGADMFTQMVSGTTLTASFTVDFIPTGLVTVQAHNVLGWGPSSIPVTLGGL